MRILKWWYANLFDHTKIRLQYTHCELIINVPLCMHNNQLSICLQNSRTYLLDNWNQSYGIQWLTLNQDLSANVVRICLLRISHCDPRFETVNGAVGSCERHPINCCYPSGDCESKLLCKVSARLFQSAVVSWYKWIWYKHHTTATIPQLNAGGYFTHAKIFPKVICLRDLISSGAEGLAG